jgi:hypothetical protein
MMDNYLFFWKYPNFSISQSLHIDTQVFLKALPYLLLTPIKLVLENRLNVLSYP